jgi:pyruvyl transferase EpsO
MIFDQATTGVFDGLKEKLSVIAREFDTSARVVYVDYPVHLNIGDLLINLGAEQFFKDNNIHIWRRYYVLDVPEKISGVDDKVVFILHGGGNFGDIWERHQAMREQLLERYPRNRFVFLPQTVHFTNKVAASKSLSRIAAHKNSKVFGRDHRSSKILSDGGIPDVGTLPDMAHQLWGHLQPESIPAAIEPLYLIREDRETRGNLGIVPENAHRLDWDQVIRPVHHLLAGFSHRFMHTQARLRLPLEKSRFWYPVRDRAVQDGIRVLSGHKSIVTDRLHAMLLGLLLGRHVTAVDNSYGKLSTYADAWLQGTPLLHFVRNSA